MRSRCALAATLILSAGAAPAPAQPAQPALGDRKPILRLEGGGPTSSVTALAFSRDGRTLYAAGFDKVVRAWVLDDKTGRFELRPDVYFRVPIGPGLRGAINALALSPDGRFLAVGGLGVFRGASDFDNTGLIVHAPSVMDRDRREDEGLVYVFDTAKKSLHRTLRGHSGAVWNMTFAPEAKDTPPLLVSLARGRDAKDTKYVGEVFLWDAAAGGKPLAGLTDLPDPEGKPRPGLACWHADDGLRVALALVDQRLRLWRPGQEGVSTAPDGLMNNTVAVLPGGGLLTASVTEGSWRGQLQRWGVGGDRLTPQGEPAALAAPPAKGVAFTPALALVPRDKGEALVALVEVRREAQGNRTYALELRGSGKDNFGAVRARRPLWGESPFQPVVAAAPDGQHVAVAGGPDHGILLYRVADLLADKGEPQRLASVGTTFHEVRFAHRGKGEQREAGLLLREAGAKEQAAFSFADGSYGPPAGWVEEPTPGGKNALPKVVKLSAGQTVLAHTELTPRGALKSPLIIASIFDQRNGQSYIEMYHGETGDPVIRGTGHLAPIRSLALSAGGRLLASAADDQTVCLWSLAETDKLTHVGGLRGLAVKLEKNALTVMGVDPDNPATRGLEPGTVIEGIVEKGVLRPLETAEEFYEAVGLRRPGTRLTLRVRRGGGAAVDVTVTVGHGTQERKPLLTLFLTRPGPGGRRDWLAWHPTGPYDSSRPEAEVHAGWHFNTGKPEAPTEFALLEQYRKKAHKKGLLRPLVALASLEKALEALQPPPRPRPKVQVQLFSEGREVRPDELGHHVVRAPSVTVRLTAEPYTEEPGDEFVWTLDGRAAGKFGEGRSADVALPADPGKVHYLQAEARLHEYKDKPEPTRRVAVRYQPPAPRLEYTGPRPRQPVLDPSFPLRAKFRPGLKGLTADVTVVHSHGGKEVVKIAKALDEEADINESLKLLPGVNRVVVTARNRGVAAEFAPLETHAFDLEVEHEVKKAPRPVVVLNELFALPAGAAPQPVPLPAGQAAVVDVPRVRVVGSIKAAESLTVADLLRGDDRGPIKGLAGTEGGAIGEEVTLRPGEQVIRAEARTKTSALGADSFLVFYRPKLPKLTLDPPVLDGVLIETENRDVREVTLVGKLLWPADHVPGSFVLRATVTVNGDEVKGAAIKGDVLRARVPLKPGKNDIQVRLGHDFGGEPRVAAVQVSYLRPPRDLTWGKPKIGRKPIADITAQVRSPLELDLDSTVVRVNGKALSAPAVTVAEAKDDGQGRRWEVTVRGVPLAAGKNEVTLSVSNAEGEIREAKPLSVEYREPVPAKAEVEIIRPSPTARSLEKPETEVHFRVTSEGPLSKVTLWRDGKLVYEAPAGELGEGSREFRPRVKLAWGVNRLHVEAVNGGGVRHEPLTVHVVSMPVHLEVTRLEVLDRDRKKAGELLPPGPTADFGRAAQPLVWVHGTLRWASEEDPELKAERWVRPSVNGFRQPPVKLGPAAPGKAERHFKAAVVLPDETNVVALDVPDVTLSADARRKFEVGCASPGLEPELHAVVISPRSNPAAARKGVDAALEGVRKAGLLKVQSYPVLTDDNERSDVFGQLLEIHHKKIRPRARDGFATNDLVVVYYHGTETRDGRGHFLWMGGTRGERDLLDTAVDVRLLEREFGGFLGAQVLLLDVAPSGPVAAGAGVGLPCGVLRHTWLGKAGAKGSDRLLQGLRQHLPTARTLSGLRQLLDDYFQGLARIDALSRFDSHLPPDLDLRLRK